MNEIFDQLFAAAPGSQQMTWQEVALYLLLAFVLSQLLAWVYAWSHRGLSYSRSQVQSMILIALIVTAVMLAIGSNVARAFGLFGALALIRFRTPVKEVRDTTFLFMAVGVGVTLGTKNVMLAVYGTGAFCLVALYLAFTRFGERRSSDALLRLAMPALGEQEGLLRRILQHYCKSFALVHLREAGPDARMEFAYQLKMIDPGQRMYLMTDLGTIPGISGVNLLVQNEDEEL